LTGGGNPATQAGWLGAARGATVIHYLHEARMQLMDIAAFQERYPAWLERARAMLEASDFKGAFAADYPYVVNAEAPWTPPRKPLAQSRLAVLTTAGLYVKGEQPRFRDADVEGDWTFRELPGDAWVDQLEIAHTHFDHARAEQDLNCVYPLERLRELMADGVIGSLAQRHYSISGYCTRADLVAEHTAPQIAQRLAQDGVDVLLHVPV
jgi:D-proline reductase (dithiol) PrdB